MTHATKPFSKTGLAGLAGQLRCWPLFAALASLLAAAPAIAHDTNTLRIIISPIAAVTEGGAEWRIAGGAYPWHAGGDEQTGLNNTTYGIEFRNAWGYYSPPTAEISFAGVGQTLTETHTYTPWANILNIVIDQPEASWILTKRPNVYTNTSGTGSFYGSCPTGEYTIVFNSMPGFATPPPISTNLIVNQHANFTGLYHRALGYVHVDNLTPGGQWQFTQYPPDFADYSGDPISQIGTNNVMFTNAPSGTYIIEFSPVSGFNTPPPQTNHLTLNNQHIYFDARYSLGARLHVHVFTPEELPHLPGVGAGFYTIYPTNEAYYDASSGSWYFQSNTDVTITAIPTNVAGYDSFFFEWGGEGVENLSEQQRHLNPVRVLMDEERDITLLFSREFYTYDNVGDIDGDMLPDPWEILHFGYEGATNNFGPDGMFGTYGNPDNDRIPNAGTNPPVRMEISQGIALFDLGDRVISNYYSYVQYFGEGNTPPSYPLSSAQLILNNGYNTFEPYGAKFHNLLECRGFDGYYKTNGPSGWVPDDDPYTSPVLADSDGDFFGDGWEYYFWYWRSADSAARGIQNSAGLPWVLIHPMVGNPEDSDTDRDGLPDRVEYSETFTDPTHSDTDGDFMDDWWEVETGLDPLVYFDARLNPDQDYMAMIPDQSALVNGQQGTVLPYDVYYGPDWRNAWADVNGDGVFTLYHDILFFGSATHGETGTLVPNVLFGNENNLTEYQTGHEVWVDENGNGAYNLGERILVDHVLKHEAVYMMPPPFEAPGETAFSPFTAWDSPSAENTLPYTSYEEYLGGDYFGRLSWEPGGRALDPPNDPLLGWGRTGWTHPNEWDSDGDGIPDGWELYVGLDPNSIPGLTDDADKDPDGDGLSNFEEWDNVTSSFGSEAVAVEWPTKLFPTDPGHLTAPPPNDPHPMDTDWDGLTDGEEKGAGTCPTSFDTDGDLLPDGWEIYAGTSPTNSDANLDYDGDGLLNYEEYWTGTVPEWQCNEPSWQTMFVSRLPMRWDDGGASEDDEDDEGGMLAFIPPDFPTCPAFLYYNGIYTDLEYLRTNFPAADTEGNIQYHTTLAGPDHAPMPRMDIDPADSDMDGMDDFWEVYHGLNPLKGTYHLMDRVADGPMVPPGSRYIERCPSVASVDADPSIPGFQMGLENAPFDSLRQMVEHVNYNQPGAYIDIVGPHNFGLDLMDPDGDGLPNAEEYSYSASRALYHTDPSPIWRTDENMWNSFVNQNYRFDALGGAAFWLQWGTNVSAMLYPFRFENVEGFDTDNDGYSDYAEILGLGGTALTDPLDSHRPMRNRALWFDGKGDFARTFSGWYIPDAGYLTRFCIEAWVRPANPSPGREQVIMEKTSSYPSPYGAPRSRANFRLGINTNGLPYIAYNGRGGSTVYQATAEISFRLASNEWSHLAGSYDGQWLTIFVNGKTGKTIRTTELPATGYDSTPGAGTPQTLILGAQDRQPGLPFFSYHLPEYMQLEPTNGCFRGYIDEVRIWSLGRDQDDVIRTMRRRLQTNEVASGQLYAYYTFDDVPDPVHEGIVPADMGNLDTNLYFHPSLDWWATHPLRSRVYTGHTNQPYNYIVFADERVSRLPTLPVPDDVLNMIQIPVEDPITGETNMEYALPPAYRWPANPYCEHDGAGSHLHVIRDLILCNWTRAEAVDSWLTGVDDNPDSTDSDGDGLPDWWEIAYGLDPFDATGENGAWGDPDRDGLPNIAEFLAGTDPRNPDSDGNGIGDYDDNAGPGTRSWGEIYTDGDGMPDAWEEAVGLDPTRYDAHEDPDGDGWSNFAEYQAGTNPLDESDYPDPAIGVTLNYSGPHDGNFVTIIYQTNTMDGLPAATRVGVDSSVDYSVKGNGTRWIDGRLNYAPISTGTVVAFISEMHGGFTFAGPDSYEFNGEGSDSHATLDYNTGEYHLRWPTHGSTNIVGNFWPDVGENIRITYERSGITPYQEVRGHFREGPVYVMSFLDMNGNAEWNEGEPLGIADNQPMLLGINGLALTINLVDDKPGFGRFSWMHNDSVSNSVRVNINQINATTSPFRLEQHRAMPRHWFHEWDLIRQGIYGLPPGTYQWWANNNSQNGYFNVTWPGTQAKPYLLFPRGEKLIYSRNKLRWTMDRTATLYHLQIITPTRAVYDAYLTAPYPDQHNQYEDWMPIYANQLGPDAYFWRVAGWNPGGESEWSDWQTFEVDLSPDAGSRYISGDIHYFGKVGATSIVIEAFTTPGFDGMPDARMTLRPQATTNDFKTSYTFYGLRQKMYYVRAFIDTTPASVATGPNGLFDPWESVGFVKSPAGNDYFPEAIDLFTSRYAVGKHLVIRDRDTDNDKLPDAWEMMYFGDMNQTGDMDYDGDGINNLTEYALDGLKTSPVLWDTDGDRLSDYYELFYDGHGSFNPYRTDTRTGTDLNPTVWDTDGDGFSDGAELLIYHTDPLDPDDYPRHVSPFAGLSAPGDYDGDGRSDFSVYYPGGGMWYVLTWPGWFFGVNFGWSEAVPMLGDYDGDLRTDFAVYHPASGNWYIWTWQGYYMVLQWGWNGAVPVPADYDGDAKTDLAVYDPASGTWYIWSWKGGFFQVQWGWNGAIPVPGDYDGDGWADFCVYDPASGNWYILTWAGKFYQLQWGWNETIPVSGDFDGDGWDDFAVYHPASGYWYVLCWSGQFIALPFGWSETLPVPGDYDNDGRTDFAVYHPASGQWHVWTWMGRYYNLQFGWSDACPPQFGR